ncbi:FoF1 ATP synthase subunit gamma [Holospora curviuscula]|uniref:ATP synthase gamma chain n=1 Tax=Holospora curviuscula TaxID=1082868 RepID=A0A2S5R8V8_9PROT|nr:FoF1 ATP synthase subunit gamma [Holospora curviuscula]PPE03632.1 ATP synthase gamma chain [Holospora curviuscula]
MMTLKELRTKRKSVAGIEQLTKALKVVSQTKLLKAQHQWHRAQKEFNTTAHRLEQLHYFHFLKTSLREPRDTAFQLFPNSASSKEPRHLIVLASDRGFCGGFNTKIQKAVWECLQEMPQLDQVSIIGKKIAPLVQRNAFQYPHIRFEYLYNIQNFAQKEAVEWLEGVYQSAPYASLKGCYILYMHYINALSQQVIWVPLGFSDPRKKNPVSSLPSLDKSIGEYFDYTLPLLSPNPAAVLKAWEKMCFFKHFLSLLQEHLVSEHSARMIAMEKAGDNATELLLSLQKQYNYLRQNKITKELVEITAALESME